MGIMLGFLVERNEQREGKERERGAERAGKPIRCRLYASSGAAPTELPRSLGVLSPSCRGGPGLLHSDHISAQFFLLVMKPYMRSSAPLSLISQQPALAMTLLGQEIETWRI